MASSVKTYRGQVDDRMQIRLSNFTYPNTKGLWNVKLKLTLKDGRNEMVFFNDAKFVETNVGEIPYPVTDGTEPGVNAFGWKTGTLYSLFKYARINLEDINDKYMTRFTGSSGPLWEDEAGSSDIRIPRANYRYSLKVTWTPTMTYKQNMNQLITRVNTMWDTPGMPWSL